jgi:DNA helicase-2/ATP-dependent DNA helicase PcrA
MSRPILDGLNPQQQEAIIHKGSPLLILAGAGSGKTRVITHRFAYLAGGAPLDSILAVTFTNKASEEMRSRISTLIKKDIRGSWVGTFHSQCCRLLRKEIGALGYKNDFSIYDTNDQYSLIRHILKEFNIYEALYKGILSRISVLKSDSITPEKFLSDGDSFGFEERLARVYVRYQDELKRCNALDFDDLIMLTIELFRQNPGVLKKYRKQFRSVLVDEFQDTNPAQYNLIKLLAEPGVDICAVGDDDQCIYGFRGARVQNILDFDKDFPGAKVIKLEQNYRSSTNILNVSSHVIEDNSRRKAKKLWSSRVGGEKVSHCWFNKEFEESKFIVNSIKELYLKGMYDFSDFAVLYRMNLQSKALEDSLRQEGFPYRVIGGTSFYHRKEIKDVTAYMRLALDSNDNVSLRRIINTPPRGIGASTLSKMEMEAKKKGVSVFAAIKTLLKTGSLSPSIKEKLLFFTKLMDELSSVKYKHAGEFLNDIFIKTGYSNFIDDDRAENVREFMASAENKDIMEFMDMLSLVSVTDEFDGENRISLMTLHCAKGLEFPVVFISGIEEGVLPHFKAEKPEEIAEERRLLYVGMTRAKDLLWLTGAGKRRIYSRTQEQEPSRFLASIPPEKCLRIYKLKEPAPTKQVGRRIKTFKSSSSYAYAAGTRVKHPKWGVGVVRDCYGDGDEQKITVNFPTIGIKRLALKFANLEQI